MHPLKLKILLRGGVFLLRAYCWFRQKKNRERMVAAMLLIPAIILLIPTYTFTLTLLQSFLFQAMLIYGLFSVIWIFKHHYRLAGINFSIYILLLFKINNPIDTGYQVFQGDEKLSILQFNVLSTNNAYDETINRLLQISPDLISFQEVSNPWADNLEAKLKEDYPYSKVVRNLDEGQGIAIFSKFPLVDVMTIDWHGTSNIAGKVSVGDETINFLSLHTRSPMSKARWKDRNLHIKSAQQYIAEKNGEFLVLGDFNTVPWDKRLLSFKSSTNLKDSRKKLTPTFPAWNPLLAQIPIDYIFHSKGIGCDSLDAVKITSDHKAILGTFLIGGL